MTDLFPPDLRERMLALWKRDPKLRTESLRHHTGHTSLGDHWTVHCNPCTYATAAALCRDALVTWLSKDMSLKIFPGEPVEIEVYLIAGLHHNDRNYEAVGDSLLAALITATESVMDAKDKADG